MNNKLGFATDDRLLIINADDFGITQGTNEAVISLFKQGSITSTSIMMPCPAARGAVVQSNQKGLSNVGIHLTLTSSENHSYRPVYQERTLHSLITTDGYFYKDNSYIEKSADPEEVRIELNAQIQRAALLGIDPTHLDSHTGSIMGIFTGCDFLEITFDLCEKYCIPFNLPIRVLEQPFFNNEQKEMFQKRIESAKKRGILLIDDMVSLPYCLNPFDEYDYMKEQLIKLIKNVKPGITQLTTHPSILTEELKALTHCNRERDIEYHLLNDLDIKQLFKNEGIKLVSWKDIRDLQRRMS